LLSWKYFVVRFILDKIIMIDHVNFLNDDCVSALLTSDYFLQKKEN